MRRPGTVKSSERPNTGKSQDKPTRIIYAPSNKQPLLILKNVNFTSRNTQIQILNTFNHPSKKNSHENINEYL